ncbi:MAG: tRNA(Ile)(2)-agmatinylcytidine synthase [Methanomassiliicoccales archaeon]
MYLAFDDTDSTEGMCTTFLATEMVRCFGEYDLIGLPRLVRLNPAVPWKTRGNGAVCLRFGKGAGTRGLIGRIGKDPVYSYTRCRKPADMDVVLQRGEEMLRRWSRVEEDASPGLVASLRKPRQAIYWSTVRGILEKEAVLSELERIDARTVELAGGRGVIGASAAMAWRPRDRTFEVLAYRDQKRWGQERVVSPETVETLDLRFPSTFNNFDCVSRRAAITPNSPCPILFGIRGGAVEDLPLAMSSIESEPVARWLLFLTNQGTDDHLIRKWKSLVPNSSYVVEGTVATAPETHKGGHVIFSLDPSRGSGPLDCAAYEPSKRFRDVVRLLAVGDTILVMGELRESPRTLNIEKLRVLSLIEVWEKKSNPVCPTCGKSMKSAGVRQGYRCRRCGSEASDSDALLIRASRGIEMRWYEPPVCSRRHLSKPLKRVA